MAMALSNTAVRVTWDPLMLTGIVGYKVYYRPTSSTRKRQSAEQSEEQSERVEGANSDSITITGLQGGVQYQFQVAALAGTDEAGPRSVLDGNSLTTTNPSPSDSTGPIVGGMVFAIALICIIILVVVVVVCLRRYVVLVVDWKKIISFLSSSLFTGGDNLVSSDLTWTLCAMPKDLGLEHS